MVDLGKVTSGLKEANSALVTSTLIVTALSGLIGTIKALIGAARDNGVDVSEFDVAIAGFDAAIATAQTRSAEYQQIAQKVEAGEIEQPTAQPSSDVPGTAPSA